MRLTPNLFFQVHHFLHQFNGNRVNKQPTGLAHHAWAHRPMLSCGSQENKM